MMDLDVTKIGLNKKYQELVAIWELKLMLAGRIKGEIKINENIKVVWRERFYYLKIYNKYGGRQLTFNHDYDLLEDYKYDTTNALQGVCLKYFSGIRTKDWKVKQYPKGHKGNISLYLNMKNGQKEGLCIQYHENGYPHIAAMHHENKEFGERREWDKERNLITAIYYYPEAMSVTDAKFYGYYKDELKLPSWEYLCNPC